MNSDEIIALRKSFESVKQRQQKNFPKNFSEMTRKVKAVREFSVGNEALLKSALNVLEKNGIRVRCAKDSGEAIRQIIGEIGNEQLIIKSKSNVTKEIGLAEELEKNGIDVIETDIGDRILQILRIQPSHPTGPIAHLSAVQIAKGLFEYFGQEIGKEPEDIVRSIRKDIQGHIAKASTGITGANAVTAEEGSLVIAHNEGNIYKVLRKRKHIIVTGIDKIYPTVEDALNMLKVISFNATGSLIPSFVEIISGVSKTADVEKKFFRGVHSPHEIVLILLDNKRSEIINSEFKELLYCIDCGNCLLHCPMYTTVGNHFASGKNLGGKGLALDSFSHEEIDKKLELCLTCGHCKNNCPVEIDVPAIIRKLRGDRLPSEVYFFLKSHILWLYYNIGLKLH
jgi:L-lactate dehydrogenase complex protein LldG